MRTGPPEKSITASVGRSVDSVLDVRDPHRYARYESRLHDLEKRAGTLIEPVGVCPLPVGVEIVHTFSDTEYDWAFCLLDDDPVYRKGQLHIPLEVRRKLLYLDELGVSFDTLVIGHEVDKALARSVTASGEGHVQLLANAARTQTQPRSVVWTNAAARGLVGAVRAFASAAVALPAMLPTDPVLLGAVTVDGTTEPATPAALFIIAAWS